MTAPKAGYKGDVYINTKRIAAATWTHAGGERQMQAVDEFSDELIKDLPLQIRGGAITITGHYKLDHDAGQKEAVARFADGAQIAGDNLKLYTDNVGATKCYLRPATGSYVTVTNCRNVGDDKSGIGTLTITMLVSGVLEQVGDTSVVEVETVGVHSITAGGTAELVGNLNSYGGQAGVIACYFKYGKTTEMSSDTSGSSDDFTAELGMFGVALAALTTDLYYYQAVALYDTDKYAYGKVKTFTGIA